jgi:hypothetical protein
MQGNFNDGGLVFDEMEIRCGLVYLKSSGRLIGLTDGELLEKNIDSYEPSEYEQTIAPKLAKKVLEIFYVSTDARVSLPLAHYPTIGLSGQKAFDVIQECLKELKESHGILIQ